jgi:hypothetical protein
MNPTKNQGWTRVLWKGKQFLVPVIGTTSSGILNQLGYIYSIWRCCWNIDSPLIFSGVHNTQSLAFCGMFCRPLLVLFLFGYFGVCHSIYGFWLHLCLITLVWLHLCYPCLITLVSDYSSLITLVWLHLCLIILVLDYPCLITLVFDYHLFKALLRHFNKHTGLTRGQHFVYKYRGGQIYWWRKAEDPEKTTCRPVASHWQTLSHNVVHLTLIEIRTHNISGDRHWLHR